MAGSCDGLRKKVNAATLYAASRAQARDVGWRNFLFAIRPEPIPAFRGPVEEPSERKLGICCSGGGIRSAAFNLGALQALQEKGELTRADYLAAVSGGSYIAAAFSMVAKRSEKEGDTTDSNKALLARQPPFAPGSPEEQYLRHRSSYLAPTGTDKLYLGYRIVLGVVINFVFLALPLIGLAMILGASVYSDGFKHLAGSCRGGCSARGIPLVLWILPLAILTLSAGLGLWALVTRTVKDRRAMFFQVWSTRLLVVTLAVAWLTIGLPVVVATLTAGSSTGTGARASGITGATGLLGVLAGVVANLREAVATPSKAIDDAQKARKWFASLSSAVRRWVALAIGGVVGPALLLASMVFGSAIALRHASRGSFSLPWILAGVGAIVAFAVAYRLADLTSWSLHPFYKRRLSTAFALKRVKPSELPENNDGRPLETIAQDEANGIALERPFGKPLRLSNSAVPGWPTLLVCAAANVSDPGATPPGRGVTSFTFSAKEIGGPLVGGVETKTYEHAVIWRGKDRKPPRQAVQDRRLRNCTLLSSVAMSGAALSPSMGKVTKRPLTFLMALANIRLGVWIPNPRWVAGLRASDPDLPSNPRAQWLGFNRPRPSYLIRELLGRNRIDAKYLYVTDGGHYENLGLVELLRRGCTQIYCFDASGSSDFEELGDAVALARSELGVEVTIDPSLARPNSNGIASSAAVQGSFRYGADGPVGTLIYARNVITADASWDVQAYHMAHPRFPNDPTVDQLYTDQRFEAYRQLGMSAGLRAVGLLKDADDADEADKKQRTPFWRL
jgi:hypothetical protein